MSDREYWDRGVANAPWITGASNVMDCADLKDALKNLRVWTPLNGSVLDVGCGTGRFAECCTGPYLGVDISPSQVAYAQSQGRYAQVITGPDDLPPGPFRWIACFSVFTHVSHDARERYLHAFSERADNLLVDIIPGEEGGGVELWRADWAQFTRLLAGTGWKLVRTYERTSPDGVNHRYVNARRA